MKGDVFYYKALVRNPNKRLTESKHPVLKLYLQFGMKDRLRPQPKNERKAWLHV
jgi:hypothetical protein